MAVEFHKMQGAGNDFVLLDLRTQQFPINSDTAAQLADRHTGIGCDQVLVLREPAGPDQLASFEVWNADGSRAEQCGNGVRCLGLYLQMNSEVSAEPFLLGSPAGVVEVECLAGGQVQVDMGRPVFEPARVPATLKQTGGWYSLEVDHRNYRLGIVSMGNPHALLQVDDIDDVDVGKLGAMISAHPAFPQGCNVGFSQIIDRNNIRLRVYERGAAETLACGSGACAAVSILSRAGLVNRNVKVAQAGGTLRIKWTGGENPVIMAGSATHVFKGILT